ncbi:MAG TPA: CBS domain-containing protein, partial [Actinomycetospora sp.]|nr:CBS domain-containing protein [Actinomycetospora sp.]
MAQTIADVLTPNPVTIESDRTVREAAELMRSSDIGDVVVVDGGRPVGIVTDRDLVVRVLATGGDPDDAVRTACSTDLVTAAPGDSLEDASRLMRQHDLRRLPVVDGGGALVGIVSLGDLAIERDPH